MDETIRIILIIIVSVSIFGLILFAGGVVGMVFFARYLKELQ